jgi:uncharacterized protein YkuJ
MMPTNEEENVLVCTIIAQTTAEATSHKLKRGRVAPRSVSFSPDVEMKPILHKNDYTKVEMKACFHDKTDLLKIHRVAQSTVYLMEKEIFPKDDNYSYCIRGLEDMTYKGKQEKIRIRLAALTAVINEQESFRREGVRICEPRVAEAYENYAVKSRREAHMIGVLDAQKSGAMPLFLKRGRVAPRSVSFSTDVEMKPILHKNDYTKVEMKACFHDKTDLLKIHRVAQSTVYLMEKEIFPKDDNYSYCIRGLEDMTYKGKQEKLRIRLAALTAVIDEQESFRREGVRICEPRVAEAYENYAVKSRREAHMIGVFDAQKCGALPLSRSLMSRILPRFERN